MLDKNTMIKVTNRNRGYTGYKIPELGNLRRDFAPKETKEISMAELTALSYLPGGKPMLSKYLVIDNAEAVKELLGDVEPEYYYSEDDVKRLLLYGSYDQLLDCLDFAPTGVLELVKKLAVDCKLNDVRKREAIHQKLGFNVDTAIRFEEETEAADGQTEEGSASARRAKPITEDATTAESATPTRRTEAPKYKVTSITK